MTADRFLMVVLRKLLVMCEITKAMTPVTPIAREGAAAMTQTGKKLCGGASCSKMREAEAETETETEM
ncbi:unnamed protein product [Soboliphyme baturini]|uniref:Secreted protein n=1 Tax=Soboliphyme baturini TaxID=241478 RepID=A0A183IL45_9BILA|nr:unnamed protein product [Soboliphyme baturini]